jgi:hypothetical protein
MVMVWLPGVRSGETVTPAGAEFRVNDHEHPENL